MGDSELTWACYLRLSRLKSKSRKRPQRGRYRTPDESVERQLRLIRAYAAEHGLNLPDHLIFRDNGRSGWQRPGGPPPDRPDWDRMIKAGKNGEFGGILVWKVSRFARNVRDGEDLLDLQLVVDGPDSGRIDLTTPSGRSNFRKQVEAAAYESDETSSRIRTTFKDMLRHGYRIGGSGRTFGFEILSEAEIDWDDYDDDAGQFVGPAAVVREDEAEVIREWARRLLRGDTIVAMAADANQRGITTSRGGKWYSANLAQVLGNPIYGGKLAYKGEVIGELANTEPILDEDTYRAVQAKLGARKKGRKATGLHPLTGLMMCGNPDCPRKGTMAGFTRTEGKRAYVCAKPGKVPGCGMSVLAEPVEKIVRDEVLARLADVEMRERARAADAALDEKRAKLRAEMDDLDADMAETETKLSAVPRSMTRRRESIQQNLDTMTARYAAAERELEDLGPAAAPAPPLPTISAEDWDDPEVTPAADKAAYIRQLDMRITIKPAKPHRSSRLPFDTGRVDID